MTVKYKLYFVFLLALLPTIVNALGLGKLELKSALNEPFEARIKLFSAKANELDSLSVRLADSDAFVRAKIERAFVLSHLKFAVSRSTDDGPDYIRVFSLESIREPFLNFLVEANWANGNLYREYTVLLDPISYDPAGARATEFKKKVVSQKIAATSPKEVPTEVPTEVSIRDDPEHKVVYAEDFDRYPDTVAVSPQINYDGGDYGLTSKLDTLWSIASAMRPDRSIGVNRMMLALLRANPDAFFRQNVNALKRGQILRMPSDSEINALDNAQAEAEIKLQHAVWNGVDNFADNNIEAQTESSSVPETSSDKAIEKKTPAQEVVETVPELKLIAADDTTQNATGVDEGVGTSESLILAQESIQALTQENSELQERLQESDALIQLLTIKNDQLKALEDQLKAFQDQQTAETVEEIVEEVPVEEIVEEVPVEEIVEEVPVEEIVEEVPVEEIVERESVQSSKGIIDTILHYLGLIKEMIFSNLLILAVVVGVLVFGGGIIVFMRSRRNASGIIDMNDRLMEENFSDSVLDDMSEEDAVDSEEITNLRDSEPDGMDDPGDDMTDLDLEIDMEEERPSTSEEQELDEDPLQEINTYLAFEQFDQAEELVRNAIDEDPDNLEYHTKLLEVFYTSGQKKEYEIATKVLQDKTNGEGEHWNMAVAMWQEMSPNRALFEAVAEDEEDNNEESTDFVDLTAEEAVDDDTAEDIDFDIGGMEETDSAEEGKEDDVIDIFGSDDDSDSAGEDNNDSGSSDIGSDITIDDTVSEPDMDETVQFNITSAVSDSSSADDNAIDFDIGEESAELADDEGGVSVDETNIADDAGIELDVAPEEEESISLDVADNAETDSDDLSLDFDIGEESAELADDEGGVSVDETDIADDLSLETEEISEQDMSLDIDETEPVQADEVDMVLDPADEDLAEEADDDFENTIQMPLSDGMETVEIEDYDDVEEPMEAFSGMEDEGEDTTVFVPRATQPDEQSIEDEVATKLDLAKAYVELGDQDNAKKILDEILVEGNDEQKKQAEELLAQV